MKNYFPPGTAARVKYSYPKARHAPLRCVHTKSRQRVAEFWIPTVNVHKHEEAPDATQLLIRAGYLRQAYAGIFQMLPLGLRVQEKLERLIDKHMRSVKASKVSLSSLSSKALWQKSGRWKPGAEFFAFTDRKDSEWLLTPTHEEEITTLVAGLVQTRQQLPIRLYQISRKYRDEKRPRGGLLRGREFLMKDLYTFDATPTEAHATYDDIRAAYRNFLDELTVPYTEARAVSGDMGGNLSHEYHFPNAAGEDIVITCTDCTYARNEEFSQQPTCSPELIKDTPPALKAAKTQPLLQEDYVSLDGRNLIRATGPQRTTTSSTTGMDHDQSLNSYAIKAALTGIVEIDSGLENPYVLFEKNLSSSSSEEAASKPSIYYLLDSRVEPESIHDLIASDMDRFGGEAVDFYLVNAQHGTTQGINLLKHQTGDPCPECGRGTLQLNKAIEVGHTFHLGTRYSSKLGLTSRLDNAQDPVPVEMGCHGIGVSRLIAAVASCLSDESGLNWPRVIAPFEAVIIVQKSQEARVQAAEQIYDELATPSPDPEATAVDVLLDDRQEQGLGWKLKDADAIGYPVIIVVGKAFEKGRVEVQCRRLKVKQDVDLSGVARFVRDLLKRL
ncbi:proline-tRNA ligase [Exophiala spinifera]|uniref:proline--tRNA ligase n=1 Tax=Exophiala spinifera TaxID=91928 RepID=A0A0D2BL36_9EURO|nr:proline-tRNA ligase [Exophiala spinifera]KIW11934.1 proline-tRNA ligase [Exophiala spinifera]